MSKIITLPVFVSGAESFKQGFDESYMKKGEGGLYTLRQQAVAESGYASTYQLFGIDGEGTETAVGAKINIPKDYLVKAAELKKVIAENVPVSGFAIGDYYIDFTINTPDDTGTESRFYLNVKDLVDSYTAGHGIDVDSENVVSLKVDATNANSLAVGTDGLALNLVSSLTNGAMSIADKEKLDSLNYITQAESDEMIDGLFGGGTKIYGVEWDGTSTQRWTRTDGAQSFSDPVPYVSGASSYGSPFDSLYPWSGMARVTDETAGELVKIPKFWYKWTKSGSSMKLQIADKPVSGFYVSPAHMDRGDGKGERDFVYVGRYHCASDYKSKSGVKPLGSKTRAEFRSGIHNLGSAYWQIDYATWVTIQMLYLVEFANWNSQVKIGYGGGNKSSVENMGASDTMPYHTGTMKSNRTTYGVGTQYRWIEDLWGNAYDFIDGIYFSNADVYAILNPANFSDTTGGTKVSARPTSSDYIISYNISSESGYEWLIYPSEVGGWRGTYAGDYCEYNASGVVLCGGGYFMQNQSQGLFNLVGSYNASYAKGWFGSRPMKLP